MVTAMLMTTLLVGSAFGDGRKIDAPAKTSQTVDQQLSLQLRSAVTTTSSGQQITWQMVSNGGTDGSSPNHVLVGTVSQTATGYGESESFGLSHGFWQESGGGGTCCLPTIRGNVDYDISDNTDISDLVYMVDYMFTGGPAPPCFEEADMDASMTIDISDLVYLVDYMFTGGPAPLACP